MNDYKIDIFTPQLIDKYDTFLFDCDGVLYYGDNPIKSAINVVNTLKQSGKDVFFISNNNSLSRQGYVDRLKRYGIDADKSQMIPSSFVAAEYLKRLGNIKSVYMIGEEGLCDEIKEVGIEVHGLEDNHNYDFSVNDIDINSEVDAVVCGFDTVLNFTKLAKATVYLQNPKCKFIACEKDIKYIEANSYQYPAGEPNIEFLEVSTSRKADVLTGKPSELVFECIKSLRPKLDERRSIMIGDTLSTDILFGNKNGIDTLLVLSGQVSSLDEVYTSNNDIYPTYYLNNLGDIDGKF